MGRVNSTAIGVHAIGEIMLVQISGRMISEDQVALSVGWSWKENISGESRGSVTGVERRGHDYVRDLTGWNVDRGAGFTYVEPIATYVHQVRPYADISGLGILPP